MLAASWGKAHRSVAAALKAAEAEDVAARLWRRDPTLWTSDPMVPESVLARLGWLDAADWMLERLLELKSVPAEAAGSLRVVLLGMGGSSLAPEVLSRVFSAASEASPGEVVWHPDLVVLDSTDPTEVLAVEELLDPERTLFFVSSKSGQTIETRSHAAYFLAKAGDGSRFVAITDPGSPLEAFARERGFRSVILNRPDIGGRYSALSFFGLAPAAAVGIDVSSLIDRAREAMDGCRAPAAAANPGLALGAALGEMARRGRDKVTLVASPGLEPFGAWVEQLLAESTGKQGTGIVPVDGEPLGPPSVYGPDRVFVHLRLPDAPEGEASGLRADAGHHDLALSLLAEAGHPVVTLPVTSLADLGGQFFVWEFATAVAGWRLGINPLDEPNVAESKTNTARIVEAFERDGALPAATPVVEEAGIQLFGELKARSLVEGLRRFLRRARPRAYVALQAYLPRSPATEEALRVIRSDIRDARKAATTVGFGPRFLHSTGQLHKGGPDSGLFIQITTSHPADAPIPDVPYSFGVLQAAQAAGDFESLARHGRRVIRAHLTEGVELGLPTLADAIRGAV